MKNNKRLDTPKYIDSSLYIGQYPCVEEDIRMGVRREGKHYIDLGTGYIIPPKDVELRRTMFTNDS